MGLDDLNDFLGNTDGPAGEDVTDMDVEELFHHVQRQGSVPLDGGDRYLISCPCDGGHNPYHEYICGIHPAPDPESGEEAQVCTGPIVTKSEGTIGSDWGGGKSVVADCPYSPHRLGYQDDDKNGGLF